jgi:hypothetical protein
VLPSSCSVDGEVLVLTCRKLPMAVGSGLGSGGVSAKAELAKASKRPNNNIKRNTTPHDAARNRNSKFRNRWGFDVPWSGWAARGQFNASV